MTPRKQCGFLLLPITRSGNFSPTALAATRTVTRSFECFPPLQTSPLNASVFSGVIFQKRAVSSALKMFSSLNSRRINLSCSSSQFAAPSLSADWLSPVNFLAATPCRFFHRSIQCRSMPWSARLVPAVLSKFLSPFRVGRFRRWAFRGSPF